VEADADGGGCCDLGANETMAPLVDCCCCCLAVLLLLLVSSQLVAAATTLLSKRCLAKCYGLAYQTALIELRLGVSQCVQLGHRTRITICVQETE
jgi:hypothetical protein